MMTDSNSNKRTINFTDDDRVQIIKNKILSWWLNKYHKKTLKQIERIARKHVKDGAKAKK